MVQIKLDHITKNYGYQTILKSISHTIEPSSIVGISGRNGSGKSTLLKIISSYLSPSQGRITYTENQKEIHQKKIANEIAFSAPYIKVTQEMSLPEMFRFQQKFKPFWSDIDYTDFLDLIELKNPKDKEIRFFSSGMQQKINLGLSILSKSKILILDEPTSYLDDEAKTWFQHILKSNFHERTTIIASNDVGDFQHVNHFYKIENAQFQPS